MFQLERTLLIDYWRRGKWGFLTTFVCATSLLLLVLCALQAEGFQDQATVESVQMHVTFSMVIGFCAVTAAYAAQGKLARFYVYPIGTGRLVACQLTFGMVTVALLYLAVAGVLDFVAGANWPLWGPAIFFATGMACAQAAIWWAEGSPGAQIIACTGISLPLAVWFSRCYGATIFGNWQHMWADPTLAELGTLAALTAGAFLVAIASVARNRRGESLNFSALTAWFTAFFASSPRRLERFSSAWQAQLWFEWRQKAGGAPSLLGLAVVAIIVLRLCGAITSHEMLESMFMLPMVALVVVLPLVYGLLVGTCGATRGVFKMTPFIATRPLSDATLATASLVTGALALLLAWSVWVLGLAAAAGLCLKLEGVIDLAEWNTGPIGVWTYLSTPLVLLLVLIESWAMLGLVVSLTMTGRPYLLATIIGSIWLLVIAFLYVTKEFAPTSQAGYQQIVLGLGGSLLLCASFGIAFWTWRRQLVPERTMLLVVAGWLALAAVGISICLATGQTQLGWLLQIVGTSALVVLPFVFAPLALSWNRHR